MFLKTYYALKPWIPRNVQLMARRAWIWRRMGQYGAVWPIDAGAGISPVDWPGWPEGKRFALVLTHDVERPGGLSRVPELAEMERRLGFRSSYYFVPEKYELPPRLRKDLDADGFEVGVHGLNHDGKYFNSREIFADRALRINRYLKEWNAVGFRMPAMHHKLDWFHDLRIEYDASTFDTDPFEPQSDGIRTIFPFRVKGESGQRGYVELPYTLPQDFLLYVLLREKTIDIWKKKLDWIVERGGMALLLVHPDYMCFERRRLGSEEYPADYYREMLLHVKTRYEDLFWNALPREVAFHVGNGVPPPSTCVLTAS
jgi:peptidoglycan/xylan/chitin deacetylase (PgdA/CDA1 family)